MNKFEKGRIFIKGNVSSSKNSKQWTGKFLVNSKTTQKYIKLSRQEYILNKDKFLEMTKNLPLPYKIKFTFIRDSKRKFDYVNPCQTVLDLMKKYEWIKDDNCDIIIPSFGEYSVDKNNPGVYIEIDV